MSSPATAAQSKSPIRPSPGSHSAAHALEVLCAEVLQVEEIAEQLFVCSQRCSWLTQADLAELKAAQARGSLLDAEAVEREWSDGLGMVHAGMLAVLSRAGARLPHSRRALHGFQALAQNTPPPSRRCLKDAFTPSSGTFLQPSTSSRGEAARSSPRTVIRR